MAQEPVQEDATELRLEKEHLVDRFADDFPEERVELQGVGMRAQGAHSGVQRLLAGGAPKAELGVEHRTAYMHHELLEEASPVDTAFGSTVWGDELHAEHIAQGP